MTYPIKILHIEDDFLYASMLQAFLQEGNAEAVYEVVHVESIQQALKMLQSSEYSAVLLDLSLGNTRGLDNVRMIKEENPDMPIIVISGTDNEDIAMKALDEGAQDYIIKGYANHKVITMAIRSSIKRKKFERDLYHRAHYDELTGLANRKHFIDLLERHILLAKRWNRHATILFIDLDHFKQINDTWGHEAGNAVLIEVGRRLTAALRATDVVARYGGDEFIVLLDHGDAAGANPKFACAGIIAKLQDALNASMPWQDGKIGISASIGIAIYPDAGDDMGAMLKNADKAMYEAKKQGGRQFRFAILKA